MPESPSGLQESIAEAKRRMRRQRAVDAIGLAVRILAIALALAAGISLVFPSATFAVGLGVGILFVVVVLAVIVSTSRPVRDAEAARAIDVRFGLPDQALSATELRDRPESSWIALQQADTSNRLAGLEWAARWPLRKPRFFAVAGAAAALLAAVLVARVILLPASLSASPEPAAADHAAAIEEMLADWEKAAEMADDPELRELVATLQPMREELPAMTEREMLLALSKLENRLEQMREAAAKNALDASAGDLASALENIEGMGSLAGAIRRKEFEKAADLAQGEAQKLARDGAQVPAGADSAGSQQQMARAAEKLSQSGQTQASAAMNQTREGARDKNASQMGQGMQQLGQCLSKAGQCQAAQARLGLQLAQLGQCKGGMGREGEGQGKGMSLARSISEKKGGKGAGSDIDPNREKEATALDATRALEMVSGSAGSGESEVETQASDAPGAETERGGREAQFARYEKLSQQAIVDENLPPAYREAIRKYFEAIRPASGATEP